VASHVRALVDGGHSRELHDPEDCYWESQFECFVLEERERKHLQKKEDLFCMTEQQQTYVPENLQQVDNLMKEPLNDTAMSMEHAVEEPLQKSRCTHVDYRELYKQMK
jgi:hypothetical protein